MKILLYSDLQLHPYKEFATNIDGINSRLLDHINVLDQIYDYAINNQIQCIVFGGDMFDARAKVDVNAARLLSDWKYKVSKAGIQQIDVVGNHDLYDKSTTNSALDLYRHYKGQQIISKPEWVNLGGGAILCIPFLNRLDEIKAAFNLPTPVYAYPENSIAIVHYGLYDVPMETHSIIRDQGYETEGQVRLTDLAPLLEKVRHVFFGHFHITTSVTDRVHFIGTPLQHKWGERFVDTRFLEIDLTDGTFKAISTIAPRFYDFDSIHAIAPNQTKGNFCRVKVEEFDELSKAKDKLIEFGAIGAHSYVVKKKTENQSRLGLNLGMSFEQMGSAMVDADYETKLDKTKLKNILADVLKTATNKMNT